MHGHTFRRHGPSAFEVSGALDKPSGRPWFADEVVVDFPSVASAVERISRGFEEPVPGVMVTIRVAALDAFTGTRVLVDVPLRRLCATCGGRGETWSEVCEPCAGRGTELVACPVRVRLPARLRDGASLRLVVSPRHQPPTRVDLLVRVE